MNNRTEKSCRGVEQARFNVRMVGLAHPKCWPFIACLRKIWIGWDTFTCQFEVCKISGEKKHESIVFDEHSFLVVSD